MWKWICVNKHQTNLHNLAWIIEEGRNCFACQQRCILHVNFAWDFDKFFQSMFVFYVCWVIKLRISWLWMHCLKQKGTTMFPLHVSTSRSPKAEIRFSVSSAPFSLVQLRCVLSVSQAKKNIYIQKNNCLIHVIWSSHRFQKK